MSTEGEWEDARRVAHKINERAGEQPGMAALAPERVDLLIRFLKEKERLDAIPDAIDWVFCLIAGRMDTESLARIVNDMERVEA